MCFVTLALLFPFFALLLKHIIGRYTSPTRALPRLPPGPWQLPLVGSLHHLLLSRFGDLPHRAMRELSRAHGPLMLLRLGAVPTLVVSSAEAAREVMKTHDASFASRHLSATLDIITSGGRGIIFSPYGDSWRELRKVCVLELFNQRRVLSFRPVRDDEVARLVRSVSADSSSCGGGGRRRAVNLGERILGMTNDVVVRTVIGGRCPQRRVLSFRPVRDDEVARLVRSVSADSSSCGGGGRRRAVNLGERILGMTNDVVVRTVIGGRCPQRRVLSFRPVRDDEVARLVRSVSADSSSCGGGGRRRAVNLGERILGMTNDVVVRTVIGGRCPQRDAFLREIDEAVRLTGGINLADLYPSSRLVRRFSAAARDMQRCQRNIFRIVQTIIRERTATGSPARDEDLLGVLLRLHKDGGLQFELTTEIISSVIFDIFAAGSETSSTTLEWAMSELMKNPRVLHRIQSELREAFKGQDDLREEDLAIANARQQLGYLHLVIKETLRLHPPAALLLPRECREACRVMGYDVPKGTKVFVNVWAIGREAGYWDDAEAFRPERFQGSAVDFKGNSFEYLPFGAGRRMCPGITLAMANMELALASLLFHFDWELPSGVTSQDMDMTETFGITVRRKPKLWLHARPWGKLI